jgi:hypothetical protein
MIKKRLPLLRQAVRRIEGMLAQYPELTHSVVSMGADYLRLPAVARVGQPAPRAVRGSRRVAYPNGKRAAAR